MLRLVPEAVMSRITSLVTFLLAAIATNAAIIPRDISSTKVLITNDDGWAVAQIRAEFATLVNAFPNTILSCPALQKSGTGASTTTPTVLTTPCEFNTCPTGSPAIGFNQTDPRLNYVNAFPVDAVTVGIQQIAPRFFGGAPDLVVSGSNVGNNLGSGITGSGTCRAAAAASLLHIPAIAFSGSTASQISYTTLESSPTSRFTIAAKLYSSLILKFVTTLLNAQVAGERILPDGIVINVNFPSTTSCPNVDSFKFVFTRLAAAGSGTVDVENCGKTVLTDESTAIRQANCIIPVSVYSASTIRDVNAATQKIVRDKLSSILTCL